MGCDTTSGLPELDSVADGEPEHANAEHGDAQLAATFFGADSCTLGVAEPEPDCCSIARAEHASEHDAAVSDSE